jgi:hypothetical protein
VTLGTQSTYGIRVGDQRAGIEVLGAAFGTQSAYGISERDRRAGIEVLELAGIGGQCAALGTQSVYGISERDQHTGIEDWRCWRPIVQVQTCRIDMQGSMSAVRRWGWRCGGGGVVVVVTYNLLSFLAIRCMYVTT